MKKISQIAEDLNRLSLHHPIGSLQKIRAELRGLSRLAATTIFTDQSIKGNYAFHFGGRTELQFNIGWEKLPDDTVWFRHGVAFSLEMSRSVHSIDGLKIKIQKFNEFVELYPGALEKFQMWHCETKKDIRSKNRPVEKIPTNLVKPDIFIFVGSLTKGVPNYELILNDFDRLLRLYKYTEGSTEAEEPIKKNENKVARICWNTNNWQFPSGRIGKIKSGTYESEVGYGHEEWLFDIGKLIDGYHYGYVQALAQPPEEMGLGTNLNIAFYTINSATKDRWWLGEIKNIQIVAAKESSRVYDIYKENGWLDEMYDQLEAVGASVKAFKKIKPEGFCRLKFKPKDMDVLEEPRKFSHDDPVIKSDYYNLKNRIGEPQGIEPQKFQFHSTAMVGKKRKTTATYRGQSRHIDLVHNQVQEKILDRLIKVYGNGNVLHEVPTGQGTKIDLVARHGDKFIFYELKTANTAKQCIREALPQLLEYSYYPSDERASKLVILALVDLSQEARSYLKKLKTLFSIPIFYQKFCQETGFLEIEE